MTVREAIANNITADTCKINLCFPNGDYIMDGDYILNISPDDWDKDTRITHLLDRNCFGGYQMMGGILLIDLMYS